MLDECGGGLDSMAGFSSVSSEKQKTKGRCSKSIDCDREGWGKLILRNNEVRCEIRPVLFVG